MLHVVFVLKMSYRHYCNSYRFIPRGKDCILHSLFKPFPTHSYIPNLNSCFFFFLAAFLLLEEAVLSGWCNSWFAYFTFKIALFFYELSGSHKTFPRTFYQYCYLSVPRALHLTVTFAPLPTHPDTFINHNKYCHCKNALQSWIFNVD